MNELEKLLISIELKVEYLQQEIVHLRQENERQKILQSENESLKRKLEMARLALEFCVLENDFYLIVGRAKEALDNL